MRIVIPNIISLLFITHMTDCERDGLEYTEMSYDKTHSEDKITLLRKSIVKKSVHKRNKEDMDSFDDPRLFEDVHESTIALHAYSTTPKITLTSVSSTAKLDDDASLDNLKVMLKTMLEKVNRLAFREKTSTGFERRTVEPRVSPLISTLVDVQKRVATVDHKIRKRQKWGQWTEWSACSVSCGRGREIRWRHCLDGCLDAETEMEEKTCQLPACSPGKLFGVIKL